MKKIILCLFITLCLITGCSKKEDKSITKNIQIIIIDNNSKELYNKNIKTSKDNLLEVLKENDVQLKYTDDKYGAYINSLMGINESTTEEGMYYWAYYINDDIAETGIENCNIKDNDIYKFVYEYYEF